MTAVCMLSAMIFVSGCGTLGRESRSSGRATEAASANAPSHGCLADESCQTGGSPASATSDTRAACSAGCQSGCAACDYQLPRELKLVSLPDHVIGPPDVLSIEIGGAIPPASLGLRPGETLELRVAGSRPELQTASGTAVQRHQLQIQPDGLLNLGDHFGALPVSGLSVAEAERLVSLHLNRSRPGTTVALQRVSGSTLTALPRDHVVQADGTVSLGAFGSVYVAGLTVSEARRAIASHVSGSLYQPGVTVELKEVHSRLFYVISSGGDEGEQVERFVCTGQETVLDALAQSDHLPQSDERRRIWIARPAPAPACHEQILPVDWEAISQGGQTTTNYQVLPGDRIYVQSESSLRAVLRRGFKRDTNRKPAREPSGDCLFGLSLPKYRPWNTCCDTTPAWPSPTSHGSSDEYPTPGYGEFAPDYRESHPSAPFHSGPVYQKVVPDDGSGPDSRDTFRSSPSGTLSPLPHSTTSPPLQAVPGRIRQAVPNAGSPILNGPNFNDSNSPGSDSSPDSGPQTVSPLDLPPLDPLNAVEPPLPGSTEIEPPAALNHSGQGRSPQSLPQPPSNSNEPLPIPGEGEVRANRYRSRGFHVIPGQGAEATSTPIRDTDLMLSGFESPSSGVPASSPLAPPRSAQPDQSASHTTSRTQWRVLQPFPN